MAQSRRPANTAPGLYRSDLTALARLLQTLRPGRPTDTVVTVSAECPDESTGGASWLE